MTKIVLLRVSDTGEPIIANNDGVLTFPSCPQDPNGSSDDPLFILRFYIVAGSKIANNGTIWTNLPKTADSTYKKSKYHGVELKTSFYQDTTVDIKIFKPGSYCYYLSYNSLDDNENEVLLTTRRFYFVVPPSLFINGKYLTLNSVTMQSVISKWVGTDLVKDWEPLFEDIERKGYNMIHFTPLQERGESNSPYSIYDQLSFDTSIFKNGEEDVGKMIDTLEKNHGILSMTDVVFNHTANNSAWIIDHPDVGYNEETAPHLKAAIELDALLLEFSKSMKKRGYPTNIQNTSDVEKIMDGIKIDVLGVLKLWQYYVFNVTEHLSELSVYWNDPEKRRAINPITVPNDISFDLTKLSQFVKVKCKVNDLELGERYGKKLNISLFAEILSSLYGKDENFDTIKSKAQSILDEINLPLYKEYDDDDSEIIEQLSNRIKYLRLDENGPKLGAVTLDSPLAEPYFTRFVDKGGKSWALANNGWIWGGNPLVDFASNQTKCYLRREVIVWGDCVKLRYGLGPDDSPYLWEHMTNYAKLSAKLFHGFRIDNCHSTPIHVGVALLDAARSVNPNLYVVAELFSGSEQLDILFVERLGISSLIREAMQAYSVGELSRLCHRHGGRPIGSFRWLPLDSLAYPADINIFNKRDSEDIAKKSEIPIPEIITSQAPHALFMDCTHDNETPAEKRTIEDTLPTAALVSFCSCATGTTFGFDECYPNLLNVVKEKRKYTFDKDLGISNVKKELSVIRRELANQSIDDSECNEMHVHHENQFITIHRTNARTGKGYFLITRTKFYQDGDQELAPIVLNGTIVEHKFAYALVKVNDAPEKDDGFIHPIDTELKSLEPVRCEYNAEEHITTLYMPKYFPQGSIAVLSTIVPGCDEELDQFVRTGALEAAKGLSLIDINAILYKCESEERDASAGTAGVYNIPDYGHLVYAGVQGWISILKKIIEGNDLAHPLASHLRDGTWALTYITQRLNKYEANDNGIRSFKNWLESRFSRIQKVPYFLVPRYFALVTGIAYEALRYTALSLMSKKIQHSTVFVQSLAMVSVEMVGTMRSASIDPFKVVPSMAAGLPHFSYDFMRCWGRDVFISARGLLLSTERFDIAKDHILGFAMTLKHGLIPNLLGSGKEPRYNARDAVWFYLQFIQDYIQLVPNGEDILKEKVKRRFPLDDTYVPINDKRAFEQESTIEEIIYEILKRHAAGIKYREANAGPKIDSQMKDEGFNIEIYVDWKTGLIHGGNQWNCGTWMDKMGESSLAGNKGFPGTPRDGAAVEINGLLKSCLRFVIEMNEKKIFHNSSVLNQNGETITFKQWDQLLQDNFEKCFYIPENPEDDSKFDVDPKIINRRGIYKDLYRTGKAYEDYQLRGNFPIAMVAAPELFSPDKALNAIRVADKVLRGPVGLRTLDPSDLNYRPYYNNGLDNNDFSTSKGRNYHQGPEWLWIMGYFLRAFGKVHFDCKNTCSNPEGGPTDYLHQILWKRMINHRQKLDHSVWAGLTELTNKDGAICNDSSPTQAWSASCLLDLYLDSWIGDGFYKK